MSSSTRRFSSLARGAAALLALLLSALGGVRLSADRIDDTGEDDCVVAVVTLITSTTRVQTGGQRDRATANMTAGIHFADAARARPTVPSLPAPTNRCGSAGGARAPTF